MSKTTIITITVTILGLGIWLYLGKRKSPEDQQSAEISAPKNTSRTPEKETGGSTFEDLLDSSVRWQVKVDRLRRIDPKNLSGEDIDQLFVLLGHVPSSQHSEAWYVTVNEIMEQLRRHGIGEDRLADAFLAVLKKGDQHEVIRDYAAQHLGQWINPRPDFPGAPFEKNKDKVREALSAFAETVQNPELSYTSIPGTTLAVIADFIGGPAPEAVDPHVASFPPEDLPGEVRKIQQEETAAAQSSDEQPEVVRSLVPWLRKTITSDNETSRLTYISALNFVGQIQLAELYPEVRALVETGKLHPSIKLNAISTLGLIGTGEDEILLRTISNSDQKLRFAAQAALKNLR